MSKRSPSPRAARREAVRAAEKLAQKRERLASLEAGGLPERPIEIESASLVEPRALRSDCVRCGASNRLEEHAAVLVEGRRLRVARMSCSRCGARREIWFRIVPALPS